MPYFFWLCRQKNRTFRAPHSWPPCGSTLRPAAIVAAVAGHKNREITSSVSPCALTLVLCGAVTLLRSHSSACPCYHHSTLECLIVSHVSLCPASAPCRVCPLCSSCVSLPPSRASCRRLRLLCCLCSPVLLYWLSLPPCAPLPVLCLWFLLSALLCMYCCRCSCSDLLRVRV